MGFGELRHQTKRIPDILFRQIVPSAPVENEAKQMPGVGMAGIGLQNLTVQEFRLLEVTRLVIAECEIK
jgi:hypothetical protein